MKKDRREDAEEDTDVSSVENPDVVSPAPANHLPTDSKFLPESGNNVEVLSETSPEVCQISDDNVHEEDQTSKSIYLTESTRPTFELPGSAKPNIESPPSVQPNENVQSPDGETRVLIETADAAEEQCGGERETSRDPKDDSEQTEVLNQPEVFLMPQKEIPKTEDDQNSLDSEISYTGDALKLAENEIGNEEASEMSSEAPGLEEQFEDKLKPEVSSTLESSPSTQQEAPGVVAEKPSSNFAEETERTASVDDSSTEASSVPNQSEHIDEGTVSGASPSSDLEDDPTDAAESTQINVSINIEISKTRPSSAENEAPVVVEKTLVSSNITTELHSPRSQSPKGGRTGSLDSPDSRPTSPEGINNVSAKISWTKQLSNDTILSSEDSEKAVEQIYVQSDPYTSFTRRKTPKEETDTFELCLSPPNPALSSASNAPSPAVSPLSAEQLPVWSEDSQRAEGKKKAMQSRQCSADSCESEGKGFGDAARGATYWLAAMAILAAVGLTTLYLSRDR